MVSNYTPVTVVPSTTASVTNRNLTWTTAYKGTSSVIRRDYTLFRDGSVVATEVGLNNLTFNYTPTVAGSYILRVIVYEANGNKIEVTAPTITVTQGGSGTSGTGTVTASAWRCAAVQAPSTASSSVWTRAKPSPFWSGPAAGTTSATRARRAG